MYQRILVPLDGSSASTAGLREAIRLAGLTQGRLRLLHMIDELSLARAISAYDGYSRDWIDAVRARGADLLQEGGNTVRAAGLEVETVLHDRLSVRLGELVAAETLQWHADLVVIGTHGRRGLQHLLLGSGAEEVMRAVQVPVLLVREPALPQPAQTTQVSLPSAALRVE